MITVYIFNYNGMAYVEDCIDAVLNQSLIPENIVFMDNASTDGSLEYARKQHLRCVANKKNIYIAGMQAQAVADCGTDYMAFCHVDCIPERHWLRKLLSAIEMEGAGAAEPEIIDGNGQVLHGKMSRNFTPMLTGKCERHPNCISTSASMYKNINKQLFDSSYKHYHDETYASEIIKRSGLGLVHVGDCTVKHIGSHSGLTTLRWKANARTNQLRLIAKFGHPAPNPLAPVEISVCPMCSSPITMIGTKGFYCTACNMVFGRRT